jgi:hypothetical protein
MENKIENDDYEYDIKEVDVIEIDYPSFTLEYNVTDDTWVAYPHNKDKYDYTIVLEGNICNDAENKTWVTYKFDKDCAVFEYRFTYEEFKQAKEDIKNQLITRDIS